MKYIVTQRDDGTEEIFVFPNSVNHDCLAEVLPHIKDQSHDNWCRVYRKPISAGFIYPSGECHGRSETLNLSSRGDVDTALLKESW